MIFETKDQEQLAETAASEGCSGLIENIRMRGLIQVAHLVGEARFTEACKVVDLLERVGAV